VEVLSLQQSLNADGAHLAADGLVGASTYQALLDDLGADVPGLGVALAASFADAQINTRLRVIHFIAQAAHETGGFKWFTELGPRSYFDKYDGRKDLGNTRPGDGYTYRGRGIFQITGLANYATYGAKTGLDLVDNPDIASEPDAAAAIACLFWTDHRLNDLADADDCVGITRKINGGTNGLADRQAYVAKIKKLWTISLY
jgi:putative chitinase